MKIKPILISLVIVTLLTVAPATPSRAASVVSGFIYATCGGISGSLQIRLNRDNTGSGAEAYQISVTDGNGKSLISIYGSGALGSSFTIGNTGYSFPPDANPISFTVISSTGNGLPSQEVTSVSGNCPGLPYNALVIAPNGVALPIGFVLRTITCTTFVYDKPAGKPTKGGEHVDQGQTWFVNKKPLKAADGTLWTEIFVGAPVLVYMPTKCVSKT